MLFNHGLMESADAFFDASIANLFKHLWSWR